VLRQHSRIGSDLRFDRKTQPSAPAVIEPRSETVRRYDAAFAARNSVGVKTETAEYLHGILHGDDGLISEPLKQPDGFAYRLMAWIGMIKKAQKNAGIEQTEHQSCSL